jgi:SAM-dependent methyltransferase
MLTRKFTHNDQFTDYMQIILNVIKRDITAPAKILDIPAGYGRLSNELRSLGHTVICADINEQRPDYVQVNMEFPLPFADNEFDIVICMEGIEHIINQKVLLNELVRITKKGGLVCISTPNISNFWSRLTFLFTGYFYQFTPAQIRVEKPDVLIDKGHISPISIYQLGYIMAVSGAGLLHATGDRLKKKLFLPLALLVFPFCYLHSTAIAKELPTAMFANKPNTTTNYFNWRVFLSRTLVAFFIKQ